MSHDRGHGVHTMTPVILADPTHRQQPGIPGFHQQLLQFTCCPDIFTLRRLVNPFLEAEDMPLHFLPRNVLPGHLQGLTLCFGASPLTRPEEHTSELQSLAYLVCRLLLEKKK